jgi:hypothetical protein
MNGVAVGLATAAAALALVLGTYLGCTAIGRIDEALSRWATEHSLRIVRKESRTFFQGPFPRNRYRPVYYVTLEDRELKQSKAWIRLGWWYLLGFKEYVEVRWDQ